MFLAFLGFFVFFTFIESWAVATGLDMHGLPPYYILAITNAASIFGRIFPNFLSDTVGPLNIQAPATLLSGVLVFAWIPAHSLGSVLEVSILYGFFSGSLVSLPPSSIASMTPNMGQLGGPHRHGFPGNSLWVAHWAAGGGSDCAELGLRWRTGVRRVLDCGGGRRHVCSADRQDGTQAMGKGLATT